MSMDLESITSGVGGSIVSAVLVWLGFKQRLDRADSDIADIKKAVVYKDSHAECSQSWHRALDSVEKKLDAILDRIK